MQRSRALLNPKCYTAAQAKAKAHCMILTDERTQRSATQRESIDERAPTKPKRMRPPPPRAPERRDWPAGWVALTDGEKREEIRDPVQTAEVLARSSPAHPFGLDAGS
eukprot:scaffold4404_cov101-Isochrysis_galbana.AAC.2